MYEETMLTTYCNMNGGILPTNPDSSYKTEPWYLFIKPVFTKYMSKWFGKREVFISDPESDSDEVLNDIRDTIDLWFISNNYKYGKLYETTILEYNPLFNVDGTTTTDRTLTQTGTQKTEHNGADTLARIGDVTLDKPGDDTNKHTGSNDNSKTGTESVSHTGTDGSSTTSSGSSASTEGVTTFDSELFNDTNKNDSTTSTNGGTTTTYGSDDTTTHNTTDTQSFNEQNKTEYNSKEMTSHNTTDTQSFNSSNDVTRNLADTEHIVETRQGNIGVTKSTELIDSQRKTVDFNFIQYVVHETANEISLGVF